MRHLTHGLLLALLFLGMSAFTVQKSPATASGQPAEERAAQDALPKSGDPMWGILTRTKIHVNEKKGLYSATYPQEVKDLVDKPVTISGFMLPLEATEKFKHFILSKRTPTCPFCPPGEPNEIIDIWMEKPIAYTDNLLKVTGTFALMNNQQLGMFFKLDQAKAVK